MCVKSFPSGVLWLNICMHPVYFDKKNPKGLDLDVHSTDHNKIYNKFTNMNNTIKYTLDGVSLANVAATIMGWLPAIAALFSIVWISIQIYEWYQSKRSRTT